MRFHRPLMIVALVSIFMLGCNVETGLSLLTQVAFPTHTPRLPESIPLPATAVLSPRAAQGLNITGNATYDVRNSLTITNMGPGMVSRLDVKIAVIRDYPPYQDVIWFEASPVETLDRIIDDYGNGFAHYEFFNIPPGGSRTINLRYRVVVNELHFEWDNCRGDVISEFLTDETYLNTTSSEILEIVDRIGDADANLCTNSRIFYDYVIDNLDYVAYNPDAVGATGALRDGGGDCTEFSDLAITLHRVGGIPARFLEGVTYDPYDDGSVTSHEAKHDWMEVYLPGMGWVPMDATWGRGSMFDRETYFAGMTNDHIVVTSGRNLSILEGGHYYLWSYWWEGFQPYVGDAETWTITKVTP